MFIKNKTSANLVTSSFRWKRRRGGVTVVGAASGLRRKETGTAARNGRAGSPVPGRGVEVVRSVKIEVQSEVFVLEELDGRTADGLVELVASKDDFVREDRVVRSRHGGGSAEDAHVRFDWS